MSKYKLGDVFKVEATYSPPCSEGDVPSLMFKIPGHAEELHAVIPPQMLERIVTDGKGLIELQVVEMDSQYMNCKIGKISTCDLTQ
jgi:hypothetical protein